MGKLLLFVCIALLVATIITAAPDKTNCGQHGYPCRLDSDCCSNLWCHTYAGQCVSKQGKKFLKEKDITKSIMGERRKID